MTTPTTAQLDDTQAQLEAQLEDQLDDQQLIEKLTKRARQLSDGPTRTGFLSI